MRIDILTACPELLESPLNHSIVQRAKDKGLAEIYVHNLRDFTLDKHRKIDDYAFGFGAGMVLQVEPIDRAIEYLTSQRKYDEIIFTAPDGERFTQKEANTLSLKENIIILCGHYKVLYHVLIVSNQKIIARMVRVALTVLLWARHLSKISYHSIGELFLDPFSLCHCEYHSQKISTLNIPLGGLI